MLATPEGREVLWDILGQCGPFASIFRGEQPAPFEANSGIYYKAGRQDLGHMVIANINEADDAAWITMQQEHRKRVKEEAQVNEAAQERDRSGDDD